ncbi:hypothetical protein D3C86_1216340 [compost metagenome]
MRYVGKDKFLNGHRLIHGWVDTSFHGTQNRFPDFSVYPHDALMIDIFNIVTYTTLFLAFSTCKIKKFIVDVEPGKFYILK